MKKKQETAASADGWRLVGKMPDRLQEKLMTGLIHRDRFARDIVTRLPVSAWDSGYQDIVAPLYDYVRKYGEAPKNHAVDKIMPNDKTIDPRRRRQIVEILGECANLNENFNRAWVEDWLGDFLWVQNIKSAIVEAAPQLNDRTQGRDIRRVANKILQAVQEPTRRTGYKTVSSVDLRKRELPPRQYLLDPVLAAKSSNIIHSWRGRGKSFFAMAICWAVATGTPLLGWTVPKKRKVLYVDGELPLEDVLERDWAFRRRFGPVSDRMRYFAYDDDQGGPMPDIGTEDGIRDLERVINDCDPDLVVIDSIGTLKRSGDPKDEKDWFIVREFELRQRAAGRCVIFIAHHNKADKLAGSATIEHIIENSIGLYAVEGEIPDRDVLRFEVRFEKHRRRSDREAAPIIVECPMKRRKKADGSEIIKMGEWTRKTLAASISEQILALYRKDYTEAEIADEVGKAEGTVRYHLRQLEAEGKIEKGDKRERGAKLRRRRNT